MPGPRKTGRRLSEVVLDLEVLPLEVFGAEVRGIDFARTSQREIDAIKNGWYRHDVLVFRDQRLTDDDLLSFSGYPEVYIVSNVLDEAATCARD